MKKGTPHDDKAVSPVLGAILILAIGVTILTNIQLNFVPVWNAQEELDHLKTMQDDFKELKSGVEGSVLEGTTLSSPLSMGFKYSPKMFAYNPRESAYASLDIQNNTWAEVRYNEVFPEGMTDSTSIKNISTSTITYALHGAQNLNSFIYEHGLIRRNGSNYTASSQTVLSNKTINLLSIRPLESDRSATISGVEKRTINIYPTSQQKGSVIGNKVWLVLHTKPEYVDWWNASIEKEGGEVKKIDRTRGIIITYIDSMEIKMGETYVSTTARTAPSRSRPYRLVKITPQNVNLPVDGVTNLAVEVQDYYNNPVPNVMVSFSKNYSRIPSNANSTAILLQNSAVSGAEGRASVMLKTGGAGFYYIDASLTDPSYTTTFVYPASSQGEFLSLTPAPSGSDYIITATLKDGLGNNVPDGTRIDYDQSDTGSTLSPTSDTTVGGNSTTTLNVTGAQGIKLTNIQSSNLTRNSSIITWDTINNITVTARSGYVFNSVDIPTWVNVTGCVYYGTSPGEYTFVPVCDGPVSSHSISLTGLNSSTVYYFIVNSSRPGGPNVNSTEYIFVTDTIPADGVPPASLTGLTGVSNNPLFVNWTWTDPINPDFDHVEVYIDGAFKSNVTKGTQLYSAFYLNPNTPHTIATRTVDAFGKVNATWVNDTTTTMSAYTYVFDPPVTTIGTPVNFSFAQNASDGLSAILYEDMVGGTNKSDRPMSPSKTYTNGTQSGVYTPTNLDNIDALIDVTIPAVSAITDTRYLMNTVKTNVGGTTYWNINGTAGGAADTTTSITISGTNSRNYTFRPGASNFKVTGTPGAAPAGYGWVSSSPVSWITSAGTWNFQVKTTSSVTGRNGRILVYIYKYNATSSTNTFLFSATGIANHLNNATTTENIISAAQPSYTFNSDEYLKVEYWLNVVTAQNNAVITFEANTATPFMRYSRNLYSVGTTYTFNETNSSATWQSISIQDSSYGDTLANVSIYNSVSGLWEPILTGAFTGGTTPAQHVNMVVGASGNASNYDAGAGQIKLRYNWTGAAINNNLGVDMINVTVVYFSSGPYRLNVTTNTTGIPSASTQTLQIGYNVSGDNFTVQVWDGSSWNNKTTLNSTSPDSRTIPLLPGELFPDGATSGGSVGDINKYYVLVRYLDLNANGVQGNLYLDYQRVYST